MACTVKTVVNLIMLPAVINLDFADVRSTLENSGISLIGFGMGTGPNRAKDAANTAINSPLLEASISGARRAIVAITCGSNVSLFDAQECVNLLIGAANHDIDIKFGVTINDQLTDEILVSVIASDFEDEIDFGQPIVFNQPKPIVDESPVLVNPQNHADEDNDQEQANEDFSDDSILPNFLRNDK